jgi:hypothetical protein
VIETIEAVHVVASSVATDHVYEARGPSADRAAFGSDRADHGVPNVPVLRVKRTPSAWVMGVLATLPVADELGTARASGVGGNQFSLLLQYCCVSRIPNIMTEDRTKK